MNMNNNEMLHTIENHATHGETNADKTENDQRDAENMKENDSLIQSVKESGIHKILYQDVSSSTESKANIFPSKDCVENGSNEHITSDVQLDDKCLHCKPVCQHQENHKMKRAPHDFISLSKESFSNEENVSVNTNFFAYDNLLNDECLLSIENEGDSNSNVIIDEERVEHSKQQAMNYNYNIVPNPNEFSLIENNNQSQHNLDIPKGNRSIDDLMASDNSIVISNTNAIPQSDSIVPSNYSLSQLQQYMSDDDDDDDDSVVEELPVATQQYRQGVCQIEDSDDETDSSTSSSTSIIISDSSTDSESGNEYENFSCKVVGKPIKAKGEMDLNDLPQIEDLKISVPEEECIPIGKIYQIVDQLVIVQANKDTPAYDLDTVLFTLGGKPLGKVFDVMGPVTEPYYCIRFNSKDHIKEKNIKLDQIIYAAPKTQYSKFVFLAQLMQLKGSDASWENDIEPPEIYLDYSDDEQEQRAKKKFFKKKVKAVSKSDSDPDEPARKRHSAYVKRMNARNLRLTAARSNLNSKNRAENGSILWQPSLPPVMDASLSTPRAEVPCHQMFGRPPPFDMRVPQPNTPFPSPGRPHFHQPEFSAFPQMFAGPSTSTRGQGPPPFHRHCASPSPQPSLFPQPGTPPGRSQFPRPGTSPGHLPFSRPGTSPGLSPFSQPNTSPGPSSFPLSCASLGSSPFPRPFVTSRPSPFPRPVTSLGPSTFPRSCASPGSFNGPGMSAYSSPSPYASVPDNPVSSPNWNSNFSNPENRWSSPFPPPLRNAPPPFGHFPFSVDFPIGSLPVRASAPQQPQANFQPPWSTQPNNRGNSLQFNFNPSVPPPSPNPSQN